MGQLGRLRQNVQIILTILLIILIPVVGIISILAQQWVSASLIYMLSLAIGCCTILIANRILGLNHERTHIYTALILIYPGGAILCSILDHPFKEDVHLYFFVIMSLLTFYLSYWVIGMYAIVACIYYPIAYTLDPFYLFSSELVWDTHWMHVSFLAIEAILLLILIYFARSALFYEPNLFKQRTLLRKLGLR